MNYYLASQLVADRQAAVAAGVTRRAQLKDARAARKARAASAGRPAGLAGCSSAAPRTRAPEHPANQRQLAFLVDVDEAYSNPRLAGEARIGSPGSSPPATHFHVAPERASAAACGR